MSSNRSPAEVRDWLLRHGVTITEWAKAHGFKPAVVASLLAGRTQGKWGEAYGAAVALGLRTPPRDDEAHPLGGADVTNRDTSRGVVV